MSSLQQEEEYIESMYDPYDFLEWTGDTQEKGGITRVVETGEGSSQSKKRRWRWGYKLLITQSIIVVSVLVEIAAILSHMNDFR